MQEELDGVCTGGNTEQTQCRLTRWILVLCFIPFGLDIVQMVSTGWKIHGGPVKILGSVSVVIVVVTGMSAVVIGGKYSWREMDAMNGMMEMIYSRAHTHIHTHAYIHTCVCMYMFVFVFVFAVVYRSKQNRMNLPPFHQKLMFFVG